MFNFLKSLFGGSSSLTALQGDTANQIVATATTHPQLSFGNDAGFYPSFSNYRLEDSAAAGSLVDVFHYNEEEEPAVLVLIVQKESSNTSSGDERTYHLLDTRNMDHAVYQAILKSAYQNLAHVPAFFSFVEDAEGTMLTGHGSDFACEMIMCVDHMRKAHEMLKAEQILVSIARQGLMLVSVYSENEEENDSFFNMHIGLWKGLKAANRQQISGDVFLMKNGEIDSVIYMDLER